MRLRNFIIPSIEKYIYENKNAGLKYIVYHSSNIRFDTFDETKITNLGGDLYGKGFYFTDILNYSKTFGKYTYKCEIVLNNPINLTNKSTKSQLINILDSITDISEKDYDRILGTINGNSYTTAFRYIRKHITFDRLKEMFDGVIGYADYKEYGKEYVVYDPDNIKIIEVI